VDEKNESKLCSKGANKTKKIELKEAKQVRKLLSGAELDDNSLWGCHYERPLFTRALIFSMVISTTLLLHLVQSYRSADILDLVI